MTMAFYIQEFSGVIRVNCDFSQVILCATKRVFQWKHFYSYLDAKNSILKGHIS